MNRATFRRQQLEGIDTELKCWRLRIDNGMTTRQIGAELGITYSAAAKALRRAEKRAHAATQGAIAGHKMQAYSRLERLYQIAMDAYAASVGERTRRRSRRRTGAEGGPVDETEILTDATPGNPRYLAEARAAIAGIRELLGLDAPIRVQDVPADRPFLQLTDAELQEELAESLRAAGIDPTALVAGPKKPQ